MSDNISFSQGVDEKPASVCTEVVPTRHIVPDNRSPSDSENESTHFIATEDIPTLGSIICGKNVKVPMLIATPPASDELTSSGEYEEPPPLTRCPFRPDTEDSSVYESDDSFSNLEPTVQTIVHEEMKLSFPSINVDSEDNTDSESQFNNKASSSVTSSLESLSDERTSFIKQEIKKSHLRVRIRLFEKVVSIFFESCECEREFYCSWNEGSLLQPVCKSNTDITDFYSSWDVKSLLSPVMDSNKNTAISDSEFGSCSETIFFPSKTLSESKVHKTEFTLKEKSPNIREKSISESPETGTKPKTKSPKIVEKSAIEPLKTKTRTKRKSPKTEPLSKVHFSETKSKGFVKSKIPFSRKALRSNADATESTKEYDFGRMTIEEFLAVELKKSAIYSDNIKVSPSAVRKTGRKLPEGWIMPSDFYTKSMRVFSPIGSEKMRKSQISETSVEYGLFAPTLYEFTKYLVDDFNDVIHDLIALEKLLGVETLGSSLKLPSEHIDPITGKFTVEYSVINFYNELVKRVIIFQEYAKKLFTWIWMKERNVNLVKNCLQAIQEVDRQMASNETVRSYFTETNVPEFLPTMPEFGDTYRLLHVEGHLITLLNHIRFNCTEMQWRFSWKECPENTTDQSFGPDDKDPTLSLVPEDLNTALKQLILSREPDSTSDSSIVLKDYNQISEQTNVPGDL